MMKKKWLFLLIPIGLLVIICVCSPLVELVPEHTRNYVIPALTNKEKEEIRDDIKNMDDEQIFWYACIRTKENLKFGRKNDLKNKEANCEGYTAYDKQIMDYALKEKGYNNNTYHYVGNLKSFGLNLNEIAYKILPKKDKNFFKNHDFVGMELEDGTKILFSPSLYDLIDFGCLTEIKK